MHNPSQVCLPTPSRLHLLLRLLHELSPQNFSRRTAHNGLDQHSSRAQRTTHLLGIRSVTTTPGGDRGAHQRTAVHCHAIEDFSSLARRHRHRHSALRNICMYDAPPRRNLWFATLVSIHFFTLCANVSRAVCFGSTCTTYALRKRGF